MDSRATTSTAIAKLIAWLANSSPELPILVTAASNRSRSPATEAANASRTSGSTLLSILIWALPCGYVWGDAASSDVLRPWLSTVAKQPLHQPKRYLPPTPGRAAEDIPGGQRS